MLEFLTSSILSLNCIAAREFQLDLLGETSKHGVDYISFDRKTDAVVRSDTSRFPTFLSEFSIVASVRTPFAGGFIFSIVQPMETVITLGISLYPLTTRMNAYEVELFYTNSHLFTESQSVASFKFIYTKQIIDLSLKVTMNHIILYVGCMEYKTIPRDPIDTIIDPYAKLFIGKATTGDNDGIQVRK